jgi:hypothetical protein
MEIFKEFSKDKLFVRVELSTEKAADRRNDRAYPPGGGAHSRYYRIDSAGGPSDIYARGWIGFAGVELLKNVSKDKLLVRVEIATEKAAD